jgi:hypothetical protein
MCLAPAALFSGCSSLLPGDFAQGTPVFDPMAFFTGRTRSWGVFENRSGDPSRRFTTVCLGKREGAFLVLDQTFTYEEGQTQHRHWKITRVDSHHYQATANDVRGIASGEAYGNVFHWQYTVALKSGDPLFDVHLEQWMYLQVDGAVLNRGRISKLGILLAQVTEYFQRGSATTHARLASSPPL